MARSAASKVAVEDAPADLEMEPVIEGAESWEWETVAKESPISVIMDKVGDSFIGKFMGRETITPDKDDPFDLLTFEDSRGKRYAMSPSYKLEKAYETIEPGTWTRTTLVSFIDTGKAEAMKDYRVDVKK